MADPRLLRRANSMIDRLGQGYDGPLLQVVLRELIQSPSSVAVGGNGGGSSGSAPSNAAYVTLAASASLTAERVLTGTTNRVIRTDNGPNSTVVLDAPQDLHTTANFLTSSLDAFLATDRTGLRVRQFTSATLDLVQFTANNGTSHFYRMGSDGQSHFGSSTTAGVVNIGASVGSAVLKVGTTGTTGVLTLKPNQSSMFEVDVAGVSTTRFTTATKWSFLNSTALRGTTSGELTFAGAVTITDYTLTWPAAVGADNRFLKTTNGAGATEWGSIEASDLPGSFSGFAAPTVDVDVLAEDGGVLATALRSDARLQLSQAIVPTWTGAHTWTGSASTLAIQINQATSQTENLLRVSSVAAVTDSFFRVSPTGEVIFGHNGGTQDDAIRKLVVRGNSTQSSSIDLLAIQSETTTISAFDSVGRLKLFNSTGGNSTTFDRNSGGANHVLIWPNAIGSASRYLTSDGSSPSNLSWGQISLTAGVTGVLPIANGGSNKALTLANGGILWTDADSFEVSAAGTLGQLLRSAGAAAPTWTTATFPATAGTSGNVLTSDGANWSSAAPSGGGGTTYTAGSVPFGDGTTTLAQDNANLVWDNAANFLGIGTPAPTRQLDVSGASTTAAGGLGHIAVSYASDRTERLIMGWDETYTSPAEFFALASPSAYIQSLGGGGAFGVSHLLVQAGGGRVILGNPSTASPLFVISNVANAMVIQGASANSLGFRINNIGHRAYVFFVSGGGPSTDGSFGFYDDTAGATRFLIDTAGNFGIGNIVPTARIHITSVSGTAALRLEPSANVTSPNAGEMWNDSVQKSFIGYANAIKQSFDGTLFAQTADKAVANTTTETSLVGTGVGSVTLPANFFVAGKSVRLTLRGIYGTTGTPTLTIRLKYGSTTLCATATATLPTLSSTRMWQLDVTIVARSTTTLMAYSSWRHLESATGQGTVTEWEMRPASDAVVTVATTAQAIDVTAQWGTASASNTITSKTGMLEIEM